jgi:arylformamidase
MKIYDITRCIQEAPLYPGSAPVSVSPLTSFLSGDSYASSLLVFDSHAGTHVDAPCHFIPGAPGIEGVELRRGYGVCTLISVLPGAMVTAAALEDALECDGRVAIRGMGKSYLTVSAARALVEAGVQAVITDAISVGPPDNEAEIHRILLSAGILVIENACFDGVPDGEYILCAFPMKIKGCDGSPVRAVLIKNDLPQPRLRYSQSEAYNYRVVEFGFEVKDEE